MNRINISVLVLLLTGASTFAQYQPGSRHLSVTGGWSLMGVEESSNSVGGFETGAGFEQTSMNGKWAYGAALSLIRVTDEVAYTRAMYRTTPFTLLNGCSILFTERGYCIVSRAVLVFNSPDCVQLLTLNN